MNYEQEQELKVLEQQVAVFKGICNQLTLTNRLLMLDMVTKYGVPKDEVEKLLSEMTNFGA